MFHLKVHIRHRFLPFENKTCVSGCVSGETFLLLIAPDSAHLAKIVFVCSTPDLLRKTQVTP